jgi:hypothetical protein
MIKKLGKVRHKNKEDWNKVYKKYEKDCNQRDQTIYASDSYPQRSLDQNAYFHGVIIPILAGHFGYTIKEMKNALAFEFYPEEITTINGEAITVPGRSRDKNTKEMTEIIDTIRHWSMEEHGCYIPEPNEIPDEILIQMSEKHGFKI